MPAPSSANTNRITFYGSIPSEWYPLQVCLQRYAALPTQYHDQPHYAAYAQKWRKHTFKHATINFCPRRSLLKIQHFYPSRLRPGVRHGVNAAANDRRAPCECASVSCSSVLTWELFAGAAVFLHPEYVPPRFLLSPTIRKRTQTVRVIIAATVE